MRRFERYFTIDLGDRVRIFIADYTCLDDHTETQYVRGSLRIWKELHHHRREQAYEDFSIQSLFQGEK